MRVIVLSVFVFFSCILSPLASDWIFVPMNQRQTDHLRAYGLVYFALEHALRVDWLLNYQGGSFLMARSDLIEIQAALYGVRIELISDSARGNILKQIENENSAVMPLERAPKIAVYTTPSSDPWDDAVTLVMEYAKVPYSKIWNPEVLAGKHFDYDWLHLHHEDFSGQYGKFYRTFKDAPWYVKKVQQFREMATEAGFPSVSAWFAQVSLNLRDYVFRGGYLFAMCSATDSLDVALAASSVDIVDARIDGTPITPAFENYLDFEKTFAFHNFEVITDPMIYEFSNIDVSRYEHRMTPEREDFTLFEFSAKFDPIPTMLTQNHVNRVRGFLGQTTAFDGNLLKPSVIRLGKVVDGNVYKYLHGKVGQGTFTFYGGHDPEDFSHAVEDPPTDLRLHKNSPGYRLILNNVLFPAARPKPRKT